MRKLLLYGNIATVYCLGIENSRFALGAKRGNDQRDTCTDIVGPDRSAVELRRSRHHNPVRIALNYLRAHLP